MQTADTVLSSAAERSECCIMFLRKLIFQQRKLLNAATSQIYCVAVSGLAQPFKVKLFLGINHVDLKFQHQALYNLAH